MKLISIFKALSSIVPVVSAIVKSINRLDARGADKFEVAVAHVAAVFDEAFDGLPEWKDLPEEKRDIIVAGLVELVVFLRKVAKAKGAKQALKKLRSA